MPRNEVVKTPGRLSTVYQRPVVHPDRGDCPVMPHMSYQVAQKQNALHLKIKCHVSVIRGGDKEAAGWGMVNLLRMRGVPTIPYLRFRTAEDNGYRLIHLVVSTALDNTSHSDFETQIYSNFLPQMFTFDLQTFAFSTLKIPFASLSIPLSEADRLWVQVNKRDLYNFITVYEKDWPRPVLNKLSKLAPPHHLIPPAEDNDYPSDVSMPTQSANSEDELSLPEDGVIDMGRMEGSDFIMYGSKRRMMEQDKGKSVADGERVVEQGSPLGIIGNIEAVPQVNAAAGPSNITPSLITHPTASSSSSIPPTRQTHGDLTRIIAPATPTTPITQLTPPQPAIIASAHLDEVEVNINNNEQPMEQGKENQVGEAVAPANEEDEEEAQNGGDGEADEEEEDDEDDWEDYDEGAESLEREARLLVEAAV